MTKNRPLKYTTQEFIAVCKAKHNNRYDYSKTEFTGVTNDIIIICPKHGEFRMRANHHLAGHGCRKCLDEKRHNSNKSSAEAFIEKARAKHGDKYDYSKVVYVNSKTPVEIICPIHGSFMQAPDNHVYGSGCPKCAKMPKASKDYSNAQNKPRTTKWYSTEEYIKACQEVHNNYYTYEKCVYTGSTKKVIVTCPVHGDFEINAAHHKNGVGCRKCKGRKLSLINKYTNAEFIDLAKSIHGDKYDYSEINYTGMHNYVKVICPEHGPFLTKASNHINSRTGCPICGQINCTNNLISGAETEVYEFIKSIYRDEIKRSCRSIITPQEIDIYLPDLKIGIEYNGLYWHSDVTGKDETYHINKFNACNDKGVKLFQIFEDEWKNKNRIVKSMLRHMLTFHDMNKLYARQCEIKKVDSTFANKFLNKYHLDGACDSDINLGLYYKNRLIAILAIKKNDNNSYTILRYAELFNFKVIRGFSYLLDKFNTEYKDAELYINLDNRIIYPFRIHEYGFDFIKDIKPQEFYIIPNKIKRYSKDEILLESTSNIHKIYDSGHKLYKLI